jgi:hypothetical protein
VSGVFRREYHRDVSLANPCATPTLDAMNPRSLAHAAAAEGWRRRVADVVAPRVDRSRLPLGEDDARALLGVVFLALTIRTIVKTLRRARR